MFDRSDLPVNPSREHNFFDFGRIPHHIGIIPDGNRRWAVRKGMSKEKGYQPGIDPGLHLFRLCREAGVKEITYYGFTTGNTKRSSVQTKAFTDACIKAVEILKYENASLIVVGNTTSVMFPPQLLPYTARTDFGKADIKVNFLVNYGWEWDIAALSIQQSDGTRKKNLLQSSEISRIDLILRWGGRRRLSGFLPIQSVYADFYVFDEMWPDFKPEHFYQAVEWYQKQDITLGG